MSTPQPSPASPTSAAAARPVRNAFTLVHETLAGPMLAWVEEEPASPERIRPVVFDDEAAAVQLRDEEAAASRAAGMDLGEDRVVPCRVYDDGSISIPSLDAHWSLADLRAQRGIDT